MSETSINLNTYDKESYEKQGNQHDLEYYDGPLLSARMCVAYEGTHMVEVIVDQRMADTDGSSVYFRANRKDLEAMLRILDEEPVDKPVRCSDGCVSCHPSKHAERDE